MTSPKIKVPAFGSHIMNTVQFHHGLLSVSDKEVLADGWSHCQNNVSLPPDLLKRFDMSLLEPQEKIPHGNASCVAFVIYVYRTLQMMICKSDSDLFQAPVDLGPQA